MISLAFFTYVLVTVRRFSFSKFLNFRIPTQGLGLLFVLVCTSSGAHAAAVQTKLTDLSQFSDKTKYPVTYNYLDFIHQQTSGLVPANGRYFATNKAFLEYGSYNKGAMIDGSNLVTFLQTYESQGYDVNGVLIYRENWLYGDNVEAFPEDARILSQGEIDSVWKAIRMSNLKCKDKIKIVQLLGGNRDVGQIQWNEVGFRDSTKQFLRDNFSGVGLEVHIDDQKLRKTFFPAMAEILKWDKENGKTGFIFMGGDTQTYSDHPAMVASYKALWSEMEQRGIDKKDENLVYFRQGARPGGSLYPYTPETNPNSLTYQLSWLINAVSSNPNANKTPTVATAASATPGRLTAGAFRSILSVTGADPDPTGESNLVYTWTSSGPGRVDFNDNGTNPAKRATATFHAPGTYQLTVEIKDIGDKAVTSSVTVVVDGPATNAAPTVQTAATGTLNGTAQAVTLAISGADDGGEAQLSYTWSVLTGPTVDLTNVPTNGTNAGKSLVVPLNQTGSYRFRATITDIWGKSVTSDVDVAVNPIYTCGIDPANAQTNPLLIPAGLPTTFTATVTDQFDHSVSILPTWTIDGSGTVSPASAATTATVIASSLTSDFNIVRKVTATFPTTPVVKKFAYIKVVPGNQVPPLVTVRANAFPALVNRKSTVRTTELSVLADDLAGEANLKYSWTANWLSTVPKLPLPAVPPTGDPQVDFSENDTNAAKTVTATFHQEGLYNFTVTITDAQGNVTSSTSNNVFVTAEVNRIDLQPPSASVSSGQSVQFTATAYDQFDHLVQPADYPFPLEWFIGAGGSGTVSSSGLYKSGGTSNILTSVGARIGTAATQYAFITVTSGANTKPVIVTAASAKPGFLLPGGTTVLSALASDNGPNSGLSYTWSVVSKPTGARVVFPSENGMPEGNDVAVTLNTAGSYTFKVVVNDLGGLTDTSAASLNTVTVVVDSSLTAQSINFPQILPQDYNDAPISVPLNATSNKGLPVRYTVLSGAATLAGNTMTIVGPGVTYPGAVVVAADQDGTATIAPAPQVRQTIVIHDISRAAQTITFPALPAQSYTGTPVEITLSATSTSALPIRFSVVSGPATILGRQLTITGTGTVVVAADQAGNVAFAPAPQVQRSVAVSGTGKSSQVITFDPIAPQMYRGTNFVIPLVASSTSGLPVTQFTLVSGPGTVSGNKLTVIGVGSIVVAANQPGSALFFAAAEVRQTVVVSAPIAQTITFPQPPAQIYSGTNLTVTLAASSSSSLPITYTVVSGSSSGTVSGNVLTITNTGTIQVAADQSGDATYAAAPRVVITIQVNSPTKSAQTITFPAVPNQVYAGSPFTVDLSASSDSGLPISYTVTAGPATIPSGSNILTITGVGPVSVAADQSGNASYLPATRVVNTITVKQTQTITFPLIPPQNYNGTNIQVTLGATSSAVTTPPLPITYSVSGPASVARNILTITGVGTVVVTANQRGTTDFYPATSISQSIDVQRSVAISQTITFPAVPPQIYVGSPVDVTLTASSSSGLGIQYTVISGPATVSGNTLTITGIGTVMVAADQPGDATYAPAAQVQISLTVVNSSSPAANGGGGGGGGCGAGSGIALVLAGLLGWLRVRWIGQSRARESRKN